MLRSVLAGLARTAQIAFDIIMLPVHGLLHALFPALSEPLEVLGEDYESNGIEPDDGADDPFATADEVRHVRELEANLVMAWAADAAIIGTEAPLPGVRPMVRDWLVNLSADDLDRLVSSGMDGVYGHLHFAMPVAGVPPLEGPASQDAPAGAPSLSPECLGAAFSRA
jgi:hypothetical protein